jgi:1-acyl-sn-glycerol-3-phosphate acyltransferase
MSPLVPKLIASQTDGRTVAQHLGYDAIRIVCRLLAVAAYEVRVTGRHHWPAAGGGLICANHQSMFDPPLVGLTCPRRMNYLARDSLFRVPGLRQLIAFLDAIPIDRDGGGLAGLKETLRRLKREELVLIFPEGTRTSDGQLRALKPGFIAVARRSRVPLIPVGLDGAFQAWPRSSPLPRGGRIAVSIGEPINARQIDSLSDAQLITELTRRMRTNFEAARAGRVR